MLRFGEMDMDTARSMARLLSRTVSEMREELKKILQIVRVIIKVVVVFVDIEFVIVEISICEFRSTELLVIIIITIKYTSNARIQFTKLVFIQLTSEMIIRSQYLLISILILFW